MVSDRIFGFFPVEVYTILMFCRICIDKGYRSRCINICLDSQVAILALCWYNITSLIVWKCYSLLCQLDTGKVILYWILVYLGVRRNEVADKLARNVSSILFSGPEPAIGYQVTFIRNSL